MQIAENWSRIRGRVEAWEPPQKAGDPGTLTIVVDRVDDVAAADGSRHRNMLSDTAGRTVHVTVPASAANGSKRERARPPSSTCDEDERPTGSSRTPSTSR